MELHIALRADDPALDRDPFFLRSQRWGPAPVEPAPDRDALGVEHDERGITLALPGATATWRLEAPLRLLGTAGDYLWLAAREPRFFPEPDGDDAGEGVFLVRRSDWHEAATARTPIPVFFLPLPDTGWSGPRVRLVDAPEGDAAVLVDATGDSLPIALDDADHAVDAGTLNLTLAAGFSAREAARERRGPGTLLPVPKSTANFGTLFTGFDATGASSLFEKQRPTEARRLWGAAERLFGSTVAHAGIEPGKLGQSLTRVGAVLALSTMAAIVLKYTLFRKHFRDAAKHDPALGPFGKLRRELGDIGTVLAHKLTLLSSFAPVWFGNGVQYLVDRFLPSIGAGRNKRLFRLLDDTVYFMRQTRKRLPVNDDTLVRGGVVLGGVSSLVTGLRLYYVIPWVAEAYANAVPAAQQRVADIFHLKNHSDTEAYARNEVVRSTGTNLASGASILSESVRQQYVSIFGPEVDNELRNEGLDPLDEENHPIREARVEAKIRSVFEQMGLPVDEELFTSTTLWAGGLALLGYAPPTARATTADGNAVPRYVAADRPGLVIPSLERTRRELARRLENAPDNRAAQDWQAALDLVDQTLRDAGKLRAISRAGMNAFTETLRVAWTSAKSLVRRPLGTVATAVRRPLQSLGALLKPGAATLAEHARLLRTVRQELFALTREGPLGSVEVSNEWLAMAGKPGASLAAHVFRRAYFGYLAGDDAWLEGPSDEDRATVDADAMKSAQAAARRRLAERYGGEGNPWARDIQALVDEHPAEYELLLEDELNDAVAERRANEAPFESPKRSAYRRRQERAATRKALVRYFEETGASFDPASADEAERLRFRKHFTDAALSDLGLYPDYDGLESLEEPIARAAEGATKVRLSSKKLQTWLESLPLQERATFEASTYAECFAEAYVDITTGSVESLARERYRKGHPQGKDWDPKTATKAERRWWKAVYSKIALAPGQPGRFQWWRQKSWARKWRFGTRLLRMAEMPFATEAYRFGLRNRIYRRIPLAYDLRVAFELGLRRLPTATFALLPATYLIYGAAMPLQYWLLTQGFFFTAAGSYMALNRGYRLQGIRPMASYLGIAGYAFLGGVFSMWGTFPILLLAEDTRRAIEAVLPCAKMLTGGTP